MGRAIVLLVGFHLALGTHAAADMAPRSEVEAQAQALESKAIAWRRDIHANPELGNAEHRTSALVAAHLRDLGLEVRTGVARTGVVGVLRGAKPGPVVALRADMDGLPVKESNDLPFASKAKGTYLGKDAAKSLFATGEEPAFFFAITLHTVELAAPSVASWNKPLILYSVIPESGESKEDFTKKLNQRTQEAARGLLDNPALKGKTVVVVWEHKHIANEKLDQDFEREGVTLRQLLNLDILPGVPKTWPGDTYDYFWIVDFPADSNVPNKFTMVKQEFGTSFPKVPSNDWDTPDGLDASSGCKIKVED